MSVLLDGESTDIGNMYIMSSVSSVEEQVQSLQSSLQEITVKHSKKMNSAVLHRQSHNYVTTLLSKTFIIVVFIVA